MYYSMKCTFLKGTLHYLSPLAITTFSTTISPIKDQGSQAI